jgi:hypothetical protein
LIDTQGICDESSVIDVSGGGGGDDDDECRASCFLVVVVFLIVYFLCAFSVPFPVDSLSSITSNLLQFFIPI